MGRILFIHGMSIRGKDDPRIVSTAKALAAAGFLTYVPEFASIKGLTISPDQLFEIKDVLSAVLDEPFRHGRLGVMAPSFSASLALKAVAMASGREEMACCLIGGYAEIESTLEFLFRAPEADEYGRLLVLANILGWKLGPKSLVPKAMHLAALANADPSDERKADLSRFLSSLSEEDKQLYDLLLKDPDYRKEVCDSILGTQELRQKLKTLDLMPSLKELKAPVVLIHGADDDVISADQSRILHDRLRQLGTESHLCISRILSHGDTAPPLTMLKESALLLRAFASFFKNLR